MKPVIFALVAMVFYAAANVLLENKLSKLNSLTIMVCYSAVIFAFALSARQVTYADNSGFEFPVGTALILTLLMGILYTAADYFFISSYTLGGNLYTITVITVMFPVFASLMKFTVTRSLPNVWQVTGYIFAAAAVMLVVKGNLAK